MVGPLLVLTFIITSKRCQDSPHSASKSGGNPVPFRVSQHHVTRCHLCDYATAHRGNFRRHLEALHGEEDVDKLDALKKALNVTASAE